MFSSFTILSFLSVLLPCFLGCYLAIWVHMWEEERKIRKASLKASQEEEEELSDAEIKDILLEADAEFELEEDDVLAS